MEPSENSELRAGTIGQAKSTGYFMKLSDWPEFDLIHPAGANRLIAASKTVRIIDQVKSCFLDFLNKNIFNFEKIRWYLDITQPV